MQENKIENEDKILICKQYWDEHQCLTFLSRLNFKQTRKYRTLFSLLNLWIKCFHMTFQIKLLQSHLSMVCSIKFL